MILLVCYILWDLHHNPLKSSINLNKAKEKQPLKSPAVVSLDALGLKAVAVPQKSSLRASCPFGAALRAPSQRTLQNTTLPHKVLSLRCAPFLISDTAIPKALIRPLHYKACFSAKICIQELSDGFRISLQGRQQRAINSNTTTAHRRCGSCCSP